MDLRTYLQSTTQAVFADAVGVTQGTISHWLAGRVKIPAERCQDIVAATGGQVTVHDLRPDIFGAAPGVPPHPLRRHDDVFPPASHPFRRADDIKPQDGAA